MYFLMKGQENTDANNKQYPHQTRLFFLIGIS
jgi:hypothetical protein